MEHPGENGCNPEFLQKMNLANYCMTGDMEIKMKEVKQKLEEHNERIAQLEKSLHQRIEIANEMSKDQNIVRNKVANQGSWCVVM
ncbi:hypothetical protein COCON_G00135150 [Conger conger]|uniref:Uncharacterized protein n=1 Tax=Conger conger TaxID=82655 RepID=A0A9Q1HVV6_CONCO|nr:hypothetical protein COCON_G00135150 [Conger conger]